MKNVLVIDDDLLIGRLIDKLSRQNGAVSTIVRNGKEATSALESGTTFHAIFLDLIVPDINGWDILTVIKNDPVTREIPVIILTGASLSKEEAGRLQNRVYAIIDKRTFDNDQINDILKRIV
ncbi:MAG: hypothetical protein A2283_07265 [Lentisphaerae bacterium RIFOXYA12_FULL_48_11]|nr:MAG: hypothetical protein A2283_07265 [Lentisphaerae bacterium RIFOXYA12_FULL_48_11]